jgi:hypothetical protein
LFIEVSENLAGKRSTTPTKKNFNPVLFGGERLHKKLCFVKELHFYRIFFTKGQVFFGLKKTTEAVFKFQIFFQ